MNEELKEAMEMNAILMKAEITDEEAMKYGRYVHKTTQKMLSGGFDEMLKKMQQLQNANIAGASEK